MPSQPSDPEKRGVFVLSTRDYGVGSENGSGAGLGGGMGHGSGDRRGTGAGDGAGGGNGTGGSARPGGSGPAGGTNVADLRAIIRRQIERAKIYPDAARRQGMQGTTDVRFRIGADGWVTVVEIERSSGYALLDEASADAVRRAGPYPFAGWIRVPVEYRLDQ